jgi:hypothetical protein
MEGEIYVVEAFSSWKGCSEARTFALGREAGVIIRLNSLLIQHLMIVWKPVLITCHSGMC